MKFLLFFILVILQRIGELWIAKRNERWMKERGGKEFGQSHYKYIVLVHSLFFVSLLFEGLWKKTRLSPIWPFLAVLFFIVQVLRIWTIRSLGRFWNTKIIVLPNSRPISKGPYRFMRHPNYIIVITEILLIPLLFQAYWTACIFTILNALVLFVRIREEERALNMFTNYADEFQQKKRFFPTSSVKS
jgi:methyltransferase